MKHFFENKQVYRLCCALLCAAMILSVGLPAALRGSAQPKAPELTADSEITLLGGGEAASEFQTGQSATNVRAEAGETGGTTGTEGGNRASTDEETNSAATSSEQREENIEKSETNGSVQSPEQGPDAARPDYSTAEIGTTDGPEQPDDTTEDGNTGSDGEEESALDLTAVLTWYKYGSTASTIACSPDTSVGKKVLTSQLEDGRFHYEIALAGPERMNAVIDEIVLTNAGREEQLSDTGSVAMQTADGAPQRYIFDAYATVTRTNETGETRQIETSFTFVISYEDGLDLSLDLSWLRNGAASTLTASADGSARQMIHGSELTDGAFRYTFALTGLSAQNASIESATYTSSHGDAGMLDKAGGTLTLAVPDGSESERYTLKVTAEVNEGGAKRIVTFTFYLDYQSDEDLSLELTWYRSGITAEKITCAQNGRAAAKIKQNQLINGNFQYYLALTGESAAQAKLTSAQLTGPGVSQSMQESGSAVFTIPSGAGASTYTVQATAALSSGKTVSFSVTITYSSDVSAELHYTTLQSGARTEQTITCENGRTAVPEIVFSDQLTGAELPFTFAISGEDASGVTLDTLTLFQSGSGKIKTLASAIGASSYSGSVQLLDNGGRAGENQFKLTATDTDGGSYTFTFLVRYQKRGDKEVKFVVNLTDGQQIPNESKVPLTVRAWSEDDDGTVISNILATGTDSELTVTLDDTVLHYTGASGYTQEYEIYAKNPTEGDENTHTLKIYARDDYGNEGTYEITLKGKRSEDGKETGATVQVSVDLTVLGLGVYGPVSYPVRVGEPVSYVIAKTVWGQDIDDTFGGAAEQTLGFDPSCCRYKGTLDSGFYLQSLGGSILGTPTYFPNPGNGASTDGLLTAIDDYFGVDTDFSSLWRCIVRNKITLSSPGGSSIGEHDFTMGSGWLYAIDGSEYPNHGMSEHYLSDLEGDSHTLTIRYTLAYGWEVGSGASGYGDEVGYCVQASNGRISVSHDYVSQTGADGKTVYQCAHCGLSTGCKHTHTEIRADAEDPALGCGTYCTDCGEYVGEIKPHDWTFSYEPDSTQHTKTCQNCGREEIEDHVWDTRKTKDPTCSEPGILHSSCECGMEKEEEIDPLEHSYTDVQADEYVHWHVCANCGEEQPGSRAPHTYVMGTYDWVCTGCNLEHGVAGVDCPGTLEMTEHDCQHRIYVCTYCRLTFEEYGEFDDHTYVDGICIICRKEDPDYVAPDPDPDPAPGPDPDPDPTPDPDPDPGDGGDPGSEDPID